MNRVHARDALVGAWRLVSWENQAADGQVTYPMGTDAIGYVIYAADGRFSITISRRGRTGFVAGDLLSGTTEEKARAMEGFVAYAGRHSFLGDRVIHHVEVSLFPNWVGSDQERWVELAGDRLTLSASPLLLAGKQQVPRLVWERVGRAPNPD
jgi:Lipocalin-like domain